jgi:hypothetical protein
LKKASSAITGGYTAPETKSEEKREEQYEDFLNLFIQPQRAAAMKAARITNPLVRRAEPLLRAIGTTIAAHGAAEGIKSIGGGEKAQAYTKMGAMLLGGFMIPGQNARQLSTDLYRQRDAALQTSTRMHDASRFNQRLTDLRTQLQRGTPGPAEREMVGRIDDLLAHGQSGFIDVEHLTAAQRQINDARQNLFNLPREQRGTARQRYHELARDVQDEIQTFGRNNNPEFLRLHNSANEVYGAMQASQVVGNMIQRIAPIMNLKSPIASALSHGAAGVAGGSVGAIAKAGIGSAIPIGVGAAAGLGVYNAGQIVYRIGRSPELTRMYANVLRNSLESNAVAFATNLKRLDDALYEDMQKHPNIQDQSQVKADAIKKRQELSKGSQGAKAQPKHSAK